jgi:hypothetical protein
MRQMDGGGALENICLSSPSSRRSSPAGRLKVQIQTASELFIGSEMGALP